MRGGEEGRGLFHGSVRRREGGGEGGGQGGGPQLQPPVSRSHGGACRSNVFLFELSGPDLFHDCSFGLLALRPVCHIWGYAPSGVTGLLLVYFSIFHAIVQG